MAAFSQTARGSAWLRHALGILVAVLLAGAVTYVLNKVGI